MAMDLAPMVASRVWCGACPGRSPLTPPSKSHPLPPPPPQGTQVISPTFLRDSLPSCSTYVHTTHPGLISRDCNVSVTNPPEWQPHRSPKALCPLYLTHMRATWACELHWTLPTPTISSQSPSIHSGSVPQITHPAASLGLLPILVHTTVPIFPPIFPKAGPLCGPLQELTDKKVPLPLFHSLSASSAMAIQQGALFPGNGLSVQVTGARDLC